MRRFPRPRIWFLGMAVAAAVTVVVPAATASAAAPTGVWATFARCPVTAPSMLAADGINIVSSCLDSASSGGSITLGDTTVPLGPSDLQDGTLLDSSTGAATSVDPPGGALVAAPVDVPGGLLGLMCPSDIIVVTALCDSITDSALNTVTATVEPAGSTSGLNENAAISQGEPIITIPVMIQLSNPILGDDCFIGSDSDPIVLTIENSVAPTTGTTVRFAADGVPVTGGLFIEEIESGGTQVDSSFAVPGASGCGGVLSPIVDPVLDLKEGLPAASGNSLTLNDPVMSIAAYAIPSRQAPDEGQNFAAAFESSEQ